MEVLTILAAVVAILTAAAVNAEVQRRLLAQGGSWFSSTIKSGLCGFAAMLCTLAAYFGIGSVVLRALG